MELYQDELFSPIGRVYIVWDGTAVRAIDFEGYESRLERLLTRHYGRFTLHAAFEATDAAKRLRDYFAGDWHAVDAIPIATNGTPFQRDVWAALRTIPVGTSTSYGAIAQQIGRPSACRAVGLANGSNPIGIVVPCHRVIGANHHLTGYGGGLERKDWLLRHEGVVRVERIGMQAMLFA